MPRSQTPALAALGAVDGAGLGSRAMTTGDDVITDEDEAPGLLLDDFGDRLSDFYSLRKTSSEEADATLDSLGANDEVDRQILLELGAPKPLYLPNRFLQAHTLAIRSLEVLDRNGTRKPPLPRIGFLRPVLGYLVEVAAKFVVRSHLRSLTDNALKLYTRREANCLPDDPADRSCDAAEPTWNASSRSSSATPWRSPASCSVAQSCRAFSAC